MKRLNRVSQVLKSKNLDAFIVTNPFNVLYLSGFKGISPTEREAILIFAPKPNLITAKLYQAEAQKVASKDLKVKIARERGEIENFIKKLFKKANRIGFEAHNLTVAELKRYKKYAPHAKFIETQNEIENLRLIKTAEEVKKIEKAQIISQQAFDQIIKTLRAGQSEEEIAERLERIMKTLGGEGLAFVTIIASGPNASLPHHQTGKRRIAKGEVLLFDFGAKYQNYCADLSRTIFIGSAKDEHKNIYNHVLKAQRKAIEKVTHGIKSHLAFDAANDIFKENNLEEYFIHGLGHGIGLEVHEAPHVRSKIKDQLTENMVFSIEPGLYMDWGGVRIEDLVTIKNGKARVLGKQVEGLIEV
ncbi:MAG: Xaa-Pro peptidase family protein [Candidatus Curtissbacteria bacterium]|nr:Xaa-Pro peptidase family protein [Candidatus Curtissbacteria bacterium]